MAHEWISEAWTDNRNSFWHSHKGNASSHCGFLGTTMSAGLLGQRRDVVWKNHTTHHSVCRNNPVCNHRSLRKFSIFWKKHIQLEVELVKEKVCETNVSALTKPKYKWSLQEMTCCRGLSTLNIHMPPERWACHRLWCA